MIQNYIKSQGSLRCYANINLTRTEPILNVKNTLQMADKKQICEQNALTNLVTGVCVISLGCLDVQGDLSGGGMFSKTRCGFF